MVIIAVYVDNSQQLADDVKQQLHQRFKMKDLGKASHCLGMRISQTKGSISLDQENYIDGILERFGMRECNTIDIPMNSSVVVQHISTNQVADMLTKSVGRLKVRRFREAMGTLKPTNSD